MAARKMPTMKQAGEQLKVRRESLRLYQKTVAAELGVSPQAVSAWERGENKPELETIGPLDELYGGDGLVLRAYGIPVGTATMDALMCKFDEMHKELRRLGGIADRVVAVLENGQLHPDQQAPGRAGR